MKLVLNSYQRSNDKNYNEFNGIFKNISTVSEKNINNYFYSYIYINPFNFENNKINNITNINNNYNNICGSSKNFSRMSSSISSGSNTSIKGFDDNDSDNFYNDNMSYKTEKSEDCERELSSIKSYKSINYCGKIKSNNEGSTINCDNNFYYNIENNIYENDEDGTNAYEIMRMIKEYEINKVDAPFIVSPPKKKYTLILDLDETLIHLRQKKEVVNIKNDINIKINNASECFYENYDKDRNKYLLQFRVGLFSFLTILKPFYEIISFTSASREYSDAIINEIEKNRNFFDYKFYREHTVIYKDTFVKDISRIGRDIKKMIIIDNNEKNFILNKENGIKIAPYYGDEDNNYNVNNSIHSDNNGRLSYGRKKGNDNVLLELKKILVMMYKDNYDDLREALKDYEDLIKAKVSMNS
jgi:Dullard-like phosphatase family protein